MTEMGLTRYKRSAADVADEQVFCYERSLAGFTLREIADQWVTERGRKITHVTVRNRIHAEANHRVEPLQTLWKQRAIDRAEEQIKRLRQRFELLHAAQQPQWGAESVAIERQITVVQDQLNKLLGTYAAVAVDVTVTQNGSIDAELDALAAELGLNDKPKPSEVS